MGELLLITLGSAVGAGIQYLYSRRHDPYDVLIPLARQIFEQRETHATEIVRVEQQRDEWKQIATRLVSGAEQQIDDLRGTQKLSNDAWLQAWHVYDKAANRG